MKRRLIAAGISLLLAISQVTTVLSAPGIGPGVLNLSPADTYSVYQWGLMNNGGLSLRISDLRQESIHVAPGGKLTLQVR